MIIKHKEKIYISWCFYCHKVFANKCYKFEFSHRSRDNLLNLFNVTHKKKFSTYCIFLLLATMQANATSTLCKWCIYQVVTKVVLTFLFDLWQKMVRTCYNTTIHNINFLTLLLLYNFDSMRIRWVLSNSWANVLPHIND